MSAAEPTPDPEEELAQLASALRAHLELLAETGATGLTPSANPGVGSAALGPDRPAMSPTPGSDSRWGPTRHPEPTSAPQRPENSNESIPVRRMLPSEAPTPEGERSPSARARGGLGDEGVREKLAVLAERVRGCTACDLHQGRTQTVFARGDGTSGICFVGEGPGADEDAQGYPFVGKAGQLLDRMIVAMGLTRDEVYVCNIVKCRPPNNRKPEPAEMSACRPYLEQQLELIAPDVIIALGATAVTGLLGVTEGITRIRGRWKLYRGKIPVMPTFHPAYLLRQPEAKREVWEDLQAVIQHTGRKLPERPPSGRA